MKKFIAVCLLLPAVLSLPAVSWAQDDHGFRFIRIMFDETRYRGSPTWKHDYPQAEDNLYEALDKTTKIQLAGQYMILSLRDERIFDYPFLYLCEPGFWIINDIEVKNLREYFARGGFMMFDDFRGTNEWLNFYYNMKQVFPDKEPVEVKPDHPIWSIYYTIDPVEAPSWVSPRYSRYEDRYYAYYDDNGRMMAIVCFNQDIGDGWEWPNRRLDKAETLPFQIGINFIVYALTH